jgi:dihydrolipoamide dehydrogenase
MGTEVTVVEFMPNIVPIEDDISKQMERSMKRQGKIMTNSSVEKIDTSGEGVKAFVKQLKEVILEADMLLSAVGIKTNIENIGLEEVGIATDKDKILVNEYYNTNIPGTTPSVMLHPDSHWLTSLLLKELTVWRKLLEYM